MAPTLPAITRATAPSSSASPPSPCRKRPRPRSPECRTSKGMKDPSSAPERPAPAAAALPAENHEADEPKTAKKKPAPFQRAWLPGDEVRILETLAAHRRDNHGDLPPAAALLAALRGRLERKGVDANELAEKQRSLKRRYNRHARKGAPPDGGHQRHLYLLSRDIWGGGSPPKPPIDDVGSARDGSPPEAPTIKDKTSGEPSSKNPTIVKSASKDAEQAHSAGEQIGKNVPPPKARTLGEMSEFYPYLVDEAMVFANSPVLETVLPSIDDAEAQALDKKIKKMRKQLTKAITEQARMKNMEMPTVFLCSSTQLQPEKLFDDMDICALARVEHELVELRQMVASQSQAKIESSSRHDNSSLEGIRCESAESGLHSIISQNQIPCNILKKKIVAPNGMPHGMDEEVTSKFHWAVPPRVSYHNVMTQRLIKPPFNTFHGRSRKLDAESQTPCNIEKMKVTPHDQQELGHDRNGQVMVMQFGTKAM